MMSNAKTVALLCAFSATIGCAAPPPTQMESGSYFPPLGLSQEAAALKKRTEVPTQRRAVSDAAVSNVEVPLEEVVFEDVPAELELQATSTGSNDLQMTETIMASLCLPSANGLSGISGATTTLNLKLFGVRPPIETRSYSPGGARLGTVTPIRFTPANSRANPTYGCGVAVRGENPNATAQAIFAPMAAASLSIVPTTNATNPVRTDAVSGGRSDLELLISTRRAGGKPLTNIVLTHK
jgi:hypothetical protein